MKVQKTALMVFVWGLLTPILSVAQITISEDTICQFDQVAIAFESSQEVISYAWSFGDGANLTTSPNPGSHLITYASYGVKEISVLVETANGIEQYIENLVVQAPPVNELLGDLSMGFAFVFHYGLAVEGNVLEEGQEGTWFIKSGASSNTGFVGDTKEAKVGFYNFDYTPKVVCRTVQNTSGACAAVEECVQLTRFDCFCPNEVERELDVCITDTQAYISENCCFNPVPEIGDVAYWDSPNNAEFTQVSPIAITTKITRPGLYRYRYHFENDLLDQVADYQGDFRVRVKNNNPKFEILGDDEVFVCEDTITVYAEAEEDLNMYWSVLSGDASITTATDLLSTKVTVEGQNDLVEVAFIIDDGACDPVADVVTLDFLNTKPSISTQPTTLNSPTDQLQLDATPVSTPSDMFETYWLSEGVATIDQEGWIGDLIEGENEFYYVLEHTLCGLQKDSVSITYAPYITADRSVVIDDAAVLYPMPAQNNVTVSLVEPLQGLVHISIYDRNGVELYTDEAMEVSTYTADVSHLMSGMYMIELVSGDKQHTFTFVKQ